MFQINRTDRLPWSRMAEMGLTLSPEQLYNPDSLSLKDAVVMFANGCTGVVASRQGLVLTNHHCGYEYIQQSSTTEHNYLRDGFTAQTKEQEIPIAGLTVSFLRRVENVTDRIVPLIDSCRSDLDRHIKADSIGRSLCQEAQAGTHSKAEVIPFFEGLEYYLLVYDVYRDVRLAMTPPSYVGKFGGESDNWMWPRYTGDFSVFRIYTSPHGGPADYSLENVPLETWHAPPLSLKGYTQGDFVMTIGYPGSTERNLSSWGIDHLNRGENQPRIEMRSAKQALWKRAMLQSAELKLKYANSYATSSNYWKYSIGQQEALARENTIEVRRNEEMRFARWASEEGHREFIPVLSDLEGAYLRHEKDFRALNILTEAFLCSSDLLTLVLALQMVDDKNVESYATLIQEVLRPQYSHIDMQVDREMMKEMLRLYRRMVDKRYLPDVYDVIDRKFTGNSDKYVDWLYAHSLFAKPAVLEKRIKKGFEKLHKDPFWELAFSIQMMQYDIISSMALVEEQLSCAKRLYLKGERMMHSDSLFYPDANFTMRLSYGKVVAVEQKQGATETPTYFTTATDMLDRVVPGDEEYSADEPLIDLIRAKDFGPYADCSGALRVALLTNNDITGGNSGSPLFNAQGEVIGLAFDGNWEGMSSDIRYNPASQRTISADIRYILFIIDRLCGGKHLVDEMLKSR